ncbi:hypothetical protein RB195_003161 [Necator americanus]|uniref:Uncharacterized protein n=1 Tax=Necator americanus TaxID=51031 RepID=A0ABR1DN34_NECAM
MDFRVRIILLFFSFGCPLRALNSVEEIPPPLQQKSITKSQILDTDKKSIHTSSSSPIISTRRTAVHVSSKPMSSPVLPSEHKRTSANRTAPVSIVERDANYTSIEAETPKLSTKVLKNPKTDPDAHVDEGANAAPPADDVAAGEGVAKEDTEPVKGKDKDENQLGAMVEDAKGNVPVPSLNKIETRIDFEQSEDSHFMTFIVVGGLLVFCLYLLHHNKKKILGLMFEGRSSGHSRRNVRYRRLSQRDDHDTFKEDVIY